VGLIRKKRKLAQDVKMRCRNLEEEEEEEDTTARLARLPALATEEVTKNGS